MDKKQEHVIQTSNKKINEIRKKIGQDACVSLARLYNGVVSSDFEQDEKQKLFDFLNIAINKFKIIRDNEIYPDCNNVYQTGFCYYLLMIIANLYINLGWPNLGWPQIFMALPVNLILFDFLFKNLNKINENRIKTSLTQTLFYFFRLGFYR